jgi:hypothetical protein
MFAYILAGKCYFNVFICLLFLSLHCSVVILIPILGVGSLVEVGCIADIFEEHAASIFMVELCRLTTYLVYICA